MQGAGFPLQLSLLLLLPLFGAPTHLTVFERPWPVSQPVRRSREVHPEGSLIPLVSWLPVPWHQASEPQPVKHLALSRSLAYRLSRTKPETSRQECRGSMAFPLSVRRA